MKRRSVAGNAEERDESTGGIAKMGEDAAGVVELSKAGSFDISDTSVSFISIYSQLKLSARRLLDLARRRRGGGFTLVVAAAGWSMDGMECLEVPAMRE
jgi:hypothetical protein